MALPFRAKLVATHVALALVVIVAITIALDRAIGAQFTRQVERRLEKQARGASAWVASGRHPERIAARLSPLVEARVTILDAAGTVLADSEHPLTVAPEVPNQLGAPEVAAAARDGIGRTIRNDEKGRTTLFLAVRVTPERLLRLGAPLSDVMESLADLRQLIFIAAAIACAIALGLGMLAARIGARPLRAMQRAANQIAEGNYDVAVATRARDDFGKLSRALAALAAQLQARETMRRDFVANVSHELRTPVTAIRGYSETLLAEPVDDATRREFLETIQRNSDRIARLVADLLRLAEIEAGTVARATVPVALAPIVEQAVATARARSPSNRAAVAIQVGPDAIALGDPHAIEQIVLNLVDNALRYGRPDGRVEIASIARDDRVRLRVSDDGPGIASEHLPRIFERFYRVDPGRSRETGGTGLGLAIAKHLAEAMRGSIEVSSVVGEGTAFTLSLPIGASPPAGSGA